MSRPPIEPRDREHLLPPSGIIISPSNINAWRHTRGPGEVFSWAQLAVMPNYGLDPVTCDYVIVRSPMSVREWSWPAGMPAPVYLLPCPIIPTLDGEPRTDGRIMVIAPAGMKKLVYPDGSITARRPKRRSHWMGAA